MQSVRCVAIKTQEFVKLSEEDEEEETVKQVPITSPSLNEIKLGINIFLQKIEALTLLTSKLLSFFYSNVCIEHLQLQIDHNSRVRD